MNNLSSSDQKRNDKRRTRFARQMAVAESRSRYRDWRALGTFRDRTPGQLEALRHLSPDRQLKFGRKRRISNWIAAS